MLMGVVMIVVAVAVGMLMGVAMVVAAVAMGMLVGVVMFVVAAAVGVLVMIRQILSSASGLLRMTVAHIVICVFDCFCRHFVCSPCHSVGFPCHSERSEGISPLMIVFVYHGLSYFHDAKILPPPCNRVAIDTAFLSSLTTPSAAFAENPASKLMYVPTRQCFLP